MRLSFALIGFFVIAPVTIAQATDCNPNGDQRAMNTCASEAYMKTDAQLNSLYKQITERLKSNPDTLKLLVDSQRAWLTFRDAECTFATSANAQGTIYPMILSECRGEVTSKRIDVFKYYLKCEEGDLSCPVPTR